MLASWKSNIDHIDIILATLKMMPLDIRAICFIFGLILCGALAASGNTMDIIIDDEEVQGEWVTLLKFLVSYEFLVSIKDCNIKIRICMTRIRLSLK